MTVRCDKCGSQFQAATVCQANTMLAGHMITEHTEPENVAALLLRIDALERENAALRASAGVGAAKSKKGRR